ncbi:hypothetical protein Bca4012_071587 [Brassica carinata]
MENYENQDYISNADYERSDIPSFLADSGDRSRDLLRRRPARSRASGRRRLPSSLLCFPLCFPVTPLRCCFVSGSGQASLADYGDRSRDSSEFAIDSACVGVKTRWCVVDLAVESVFFSWLRERIVFSEFLLNYEPALYCVSKYCRVYRRVENSFKVQWRDLVRIEGCLQRRLKILTSFSSLRMVFVTSPALGFGWYLLPRRLLASDIIVIVCV